MTEERTEKIWKRKCVKIAGMPWSFASPSLNQITSAASGAVIPIKARFCLWRIRTAAGGGSLLLALLTGYAGHPEQDEGSWLRSSRLPEQGEGSWLRSMSILTGKNRKLRI